MHVLIVPSWYPTSEAPLDGIYFAEQAQCLAQSGMQVGVVYPEQQSLRRSSWSALKAKHFQTEWTQESGVPTLRRYGWNVWSRFPPGHSIRVRSAVKLAHRYVDRYGVPDLLHAQSGRWAGAAAARIGTHFSIPVVLTEHFSGFLRNSIFPWRWPLIREGYRNAEVTSAVSTALKNAIADHDLSPRSEVILHPNLAPTAQFRPPPHRTPPPPFHLVTIARLNPRKNIDGLLEALATAVTRAPDSTSNLRLRIIGDGPERPRLERKASALDLNQRVRFLGTLDRESVQETLHSSHAFVLPSLHETFGVVLLEAMATGLPVIATSSGGPEDLVASTTGFLVPPDDTGALSEALLSLRQQWTSFEAESIRRHICGRYGPEPFVRRTRSLYRRALGKAG